MRNQNNHGHARILKNAPRVHRFLPFHSPQSTTHLCGDKSWLFLHSNFIFSHRVLVVILLFQFIPTSKYPKQVTQSEQQSQGGDLQKHKKW